MINDPLGIPTTRWVRLEGDTAVEKFDENVALLIRKGYSEPEARKRAEEAKTTYPGHSLCFKVRN